MIRQRCVRVRAESNGTPRFVKMFPALLGPVAKKRNETIKENINKIVAIGTAEVKEAYELALELDEAHKKALKIKSKKEEPESAPVSDTEESIFTQNDS